MLAGTYQGPILPHTLLGLYGKPNPHDHQPLWVDKYLLVLTCVMGH